MPDDLPELRIPKPHGRLLSTEERGWTSELEGAIQNAGGPAATGTGMEDLGRLSDFEIAAHAIVAKDDTDLALHRIRRMKKFREMHKIPNDGTTTVFQAIQILHKFFHAYPDFVRAFGTDKHGRHVLSFRLSALTSPPPFNHTEEDRFAALYYLFHAMQPDLDSIRKGTIFIGDLRGVTRHTIFAHGLFGGGRALTKDSYPIRVKDFPCHHPPSRFSAVAALCWPFFSTKLAERYVEVTTSKLGEHFPRDLLSRDLGGTLSQADILERIENNLRRRFENAESFRL
jgi:CRAL/TRIO domain